MSVSSELYSLSAPSLWANGPQRGCDIYTTHFTYMWVFFVQKVNFILSSIEIKVDPLKHKKINCWCDKNVITFLQRRSNTNSDAACHSQYPSAFSSTPWTWKIVSFETEKFNLIQETECPNVYLPQYFLSKRFYLRKTFL